MNDPQNDDQIRARAIALAQRLEDDEEFKERLLADPETALTEAGLPVDCFGPFLTEVGLEADVGGYELMDEDCIPRCVLTTWPPD